MGTTHVGDGPRSLRRSGTKCGKARSPGAVGAGARRRVRALPGAVERSGGVVPFRAEFGAVPDAGGDKPRPYEASPTSSAAAEGWR